MKNSKDFIHFVLLRSPNGRIRSHYSFSSYSDLEGNIIEYHEGAIHPKTGQKEPVDFNFSRRHKVMPVHRNAGAKDRNGNYIKKVDYMRGHPECEGSPNNTGQRCWFKEMDSDKDVDIALEAGNTRRKAETMAANLSGDELRNVAALYRETSESVKKQKFAVLQWAFHDPEAFINQMNSDDFKLRGFIQRCLSHNVFEKYGTLIKWGDVTIGIDENDAVRSLLLDTDTAKAVATLLVKAENPEESISVPPKEPESRKGSIKNQVKAEIAKAKAAKK